MLGFGPTSSQANGSTDRSPIGGVATLTASAAVSLKGSAKLGASAALAGKATVSASPSGVRTASVQLVGRASTSTSAIRARLASVSIRVSADLKARGGIVARPRVSLLARAALGIEPSSAFEDLVNNPNRRLIYTIEMSPWLLVPYEDQA